ncbi:MAG: nucleotide-binding protein [Burkholderiaceae bacterium]
MAQRASVFIGSSSEGLPIAKAIQRGLSSSVDATLWKQGVFQPGFSYLESLVKTLNSADFAVLVLTPDDVNESRGENYNSPRDNVVFELGLFIGRLGRERSFFVYDQNQPPKLPSDLLGIAASVFQAREDENLEAAVGPACTEIESVIARIGCRTKMLKFTDDELNAVSGGPTLAGTWAGFDPDAQDPSQQVSTLVIEQHGIFVRASINRLSSKGGTRLFEYEGKFTSGQLVLFYEDTRGRGYIVGTMVLHLSEDLRTLIGRTTYFSHDESRVVSFQREYRRS